MQPGILRKAFFPAMFLTALLVGGCGTAPLQEGPEVEARFPVSEIVKEDVTYPVDVYDPWEGFNRTMYNFNARFDEYIFLPVVDGYRFITPTIVQAGVTNFFNNLGDLKTLLNTIVQLKPMPSLETASRLVWNTTAGLLGVIDVASAMDITRHEEDFGQTLGHYGVGDGPYLVLPILGPSNLRDTTGLVVDTLAFREIDPLDLDDHSDREILYFLLNAIDTRANIGFRYYQTGSPFEYDMVRMLYTTKRKLDIAK
ncbi:MAG: VacJ family lipoprotein [Gammaproteobacteria bacterium]|nr:VacJ family lipoprotein [Gammaproteobacteria bacterium]